VKLALALLAVFSFGSSGSIASADDVTLPNTKAKLHVGPEWKPITATGLVVAYKSDAGATLAVTRAQVGNADAWRSKTRDAYVDLVERGLRDKVPGYKRVARKISELHEVPAVDLEARRDGGATLVLRVLLFRTYALTLAIEVPAGGDATSARAVATSFSP
jgi:hypothetical protein